MPGVQELSQQVRSIIEVVIRFVRARKREEASISFGALLILGGVYLANGLEKVGLKEFFAWWHGEAIVRGLLIATGIGFVLYGGYKIFRLVYVPPLPPGKDRPSAIKGPMAFTEADGELFRKLGRESELQKLLGLALDDQVLLIVIRGASGAGKTSLLRAGLKHILGERAIFHYWEAVPKEPEEGLLRAVHKDWPDGATKPASLEELVNPAETLGRQSHVFVLDQFEQLRGNRKMFALLRRIVRESKPPHRITWVIAFRREFSADWLDFISPEIERGIRPPQDVSLRLFTAEQAREVIGQLVNESNLKDSIEQSVINNLVEAATVEGEVSPVDIGIGLLVLAELHERQSGNTITIRDYQFAGGAEGLLTQYISRCLDLFPKEHQEAILKAMLALRDPETNQRLAEGRTVEELAAESGAEARLLKTQLDRLSHRDTRLLETVTPADDSPMRYRLPHERLVPALYRLTGKLLAEVDQAKLKFQNAFQAWKNNDKRSAYLLKAKELRLVERYETQIPWGNDEQEKKNFLQRSKHHHKIIKGAAVAAVIALLVISWASYLQYQRFEGRRYLRESGYPPELYDWQHRLKKLELMQPLDLDRFAWFSSDSIEELELHAVNSSNSIAGLASLSKCRLLKKLSLGLTESQVSNLEPLSTLNDLTQLTLDLRYSQVGDLKPLSKLSNLTQLTLDLDISQVEDIEPLSKLSNLTQLTLDLSESRVKDIEPLSMLSNLKQLTLNLRDAQVSDLQWLSKLNNLAQLSLFAGRDVEFYLELLPKLSNRTQITLIFSEYEISDLESLSKLSNQTQLMLYYYGKLNSLEPLLQLNNLTRLELESDLGQVKNLEPLSKLSNLKELTLDLGQSQGRDLEPLAKLGDETQLTLDFSNSSTSNLELLAKLGNRTQLALNLGHNKVRNLEPLSKLSSLAQLTLALGGSEVSDLGGLSKLSNLTQLNLDLSRSEVSSWEPPLNQDNRAQMMHDRFRSTSDVHNMEPLSKLSNLTQLMLSLTGSEVRDLEPLSKLSNLTQLTLDFRSSEIRSLEPLLELRKLTQLTLGPGGSQVDNLEPLAKLTRLQALSIWDATRAQRISLRSIPASLVELKF